MSVIEISQQLSSCARVRGETSNAGLRPLGSFLLVAVVYWLLFWRIIKNNRGNRVIQCGSITLMLAIVMMLLMKLTNLPNWVLPSLGLLVFLLCLLTTFFLLVQGVQTIRHHKSKAASQSDSATDYVVHELDYEPRNFREKRLLRIVYWGTILVVAFRVWEKTSKRDDRVVEVDPATPDRGGF